MQEKCYKCIKQSKIGQEYGKAYAKEHLNVTQLPSFIRSFLKSKRHAGLQKHIICQMYKLQLMKNSEIETRNSRPVQVHHLNWRSENWLLKLKKKEHQFSFFLRKPFPTNFENKNAYSDLIGLSVMVLARFPHPSSAGWLNVSLTTRFRGFSSY